MPHRNNNYKAKPSPYPYCQEFQCNPAQKKQTNKVKVSNEQRPS